ncbi:hypothetical protein PAL_GLEAN10014120 [Pteropus alecto]|uniref:Uncharacterized protein n=1 Tax=Pteropus alecto TaxID=9402 RepID=L5L0P0_PTEAL|nr:hypothetical protein PAL_GLEAN10014120 [Pteropus alecto]
MGHQEGDRPRGSPVAPSPAAERLLSRPSPLVLTDERAVLKSTVFNSGSSVFFVTFVILCPASK